VRRGGQPVEQRLEVKVSVGGRGNGGRAR
jgi:hypothetical protein